MSATNHPWCRDVRRDEVVRAAEDAAAVPAIQHRDLPEQVSLLWASVGDLIGRVVRLEGEMDAGQDEEAAPAEGMRKEHGESVRVVEDADAASDEAIAHGATLSALAEARESLAAANRGIARLTAERNAALRERDAAQSQCEELERAALVDHQTIGTLRARVAELEANANTATILAKIRDSEWSVASELAAEANAELSAASAARGWLTAEERKAIRYIAATHEGWSEDDQPLKVIDALLARETPPRVRRPNPNVVITTAYARERIDRQWIAAIRAAGGEVE